MGEEVRCEWKVRSCSSEAEVHEASNALKSELYRVWQTAQPADEAWLVLEVHPPSAFSELEIVNAGSALIEVFGLPDDCPHRDDDYDDDYIMLLSAQQLMSAKDVINKANRNRPFTYTCSNKLVQLALQHRWKQIKVVCRQPFGSEEHKTCIGLSRLSFKHCKTSAQVANDAAEARVEQNLKAGLAKMFPKGSSGAECQVVSQVTEPSRPIQACKVDKDLGANVASHESPPPVRGKRKLPTWKSPTKGMKNGRKGGDGSHGAVSSEEDEEVAKASQRPKATPKVERPERKEPMPSSQKSSSPKKQEEKLSARIKEHSGSHRHEDTPQQPSKRPPLQITKAQPNSKPGSNQHAKAQSRKGSELESTSRPETHHPPQSKLDGASLKVVDQPESSSKRKEPPSSQCTNSSPTEGNKRRVQSTSKHEPNQANATTLPFSKFMDGVIFAISGLVNPERAEIRDKSLEMGGQYRPDWSADCTLLICAFANTPKFNQVKKENGTIVSKVWIKECYQQKKLVDIEKYLLHAGKPWRQIGAAAISEPDEDPPSRTGHDNDESLTTLASLQEVEKWVHEDVTSSIAWLQQQEVQPEVEELRSVAVQGIQLCLDDTVECLRKKQSIKKIMESWDYVPRAVQELAGREDKAGKVKRKDFWSDMLCEAERLKWIYSKALENVTLAEEELTKEGSMNGEDEDTDVMRDDASSEDTQVLDEDDISEAKEAISKFISGLAL